MSSNYIFGCYFLSGLERLHACICLRTWLQHLKKHGGCRQLEIAVVDLCFRDGGFQYPIKALILPAKGVHISLTFAFMN